MKFTLSLADRLVEHPSFQYADREVPASCLASSSFSGRYENLTPVSGGCFPHPFKCPYAAKILDEGSDVDRY